MRRLGRFLTTMDGRIKGRPSTFAQLASLARPYWPHLAAIFLLGAIAAPIGLLLAFPLKLVVDNVIGDLPLPHGIEVLVPSALHTSKVANLMLAVGMLLALSLLMNLQSFTAWLLQTYTGEKLVMDFRTRLFWHVQRMGLPFHDRRGTNDVAYRIQHDAAAVQYLFLQGAVPLVSSSLSFLALLYVTMRLDWKLSVVAVAVSPLLLLLARKSGHKSRDGWEGIKKLDSAAMQVLHEALASIRVVKAFGREEFENQRFQLRSRDRMTAQVKVASQLALFHLSITATIAAGTAAALWIGARHVQSGLLTLGDLLLVMAYMAQLYDPLRVVSAKVPEVQGWMVSVRRALALLDEPPELGDTRHATPLQRAQGRISFRDVSFSYAKSGRALNGVTFEIPPGTRVGIVGASGSGKSTLVNLLTRFYDPESGQILLDGRDLRDYRLPDLRRQFAVILQDPVVFSATVAENISYGDPSAGRNEVIAAARAAMAHVFIEALPQGYDTRIGEGACPLSGGERQRLGIARAFLRDAPVMILDEPTSAVDVNTEDEIMKAMRSLAQGRTTLVIAHRLSTVQDCGLLLVLQQGRLITATSDFREAVQALGESDSLRLAEETTSRRP
ncbi:MAG TPA: ABC transporter ATP-binding protein [Candidatus Angelobacter sp.]|nr:ABC transporter ATP-binding protein [Candidatus Angelobacter sp.]